MSLAAIVYVRATTSLYLLTYIHIQYIALYIYIYIWQTL